MKNLLLVYPTNKRLFQQPSLGIMYLAAVAEKEGHKVRIIEGGGSDLHEEMVQQKWWHPDIVGITCMTPMFRSVLGVAAVAKEFYDPRPTVVVGGPHASIMPETLMENKNIDNAVIGEGEETFKEILSEKPACEIDGLLYKCSMFGVKYTAPRDFIKDLDTIPFPARHLVDNKYFKKGRCSILASRGCPFNCSFCQPTLRKIFGQKVRWRSAFNVVCEMIECERNFKTDYFEFFDDTFTANKNFVYDFCERAKVATSSRWEILTRVNMVDEDMLKTMKDARLVKISFGVESGSQKILDSLNKGITIEQVKEAFRLCKKVGIKTHALFMVGSLGETKETLKETRELIKEIKPDTMYASITTPLPHTYLYDRCVDEKRIIGDLLENVDYYRTPIMKVDGLSPEQIASERTSMLTSFMTRKMMNPKSTISYLREHGWRNTLNLAKNLFGGD